MYIIHNILQNQYDKCLQMYAFCGVRIYVIGTVQYAVTKLYAVPSKLDSPTRVLLP